MHAPGVEVFVHAPTVGHRVVAVALGSEGVVVHGLESGGGSALEVDGVRINRPDGPLPDGALLWMGGVGSRVAVAPARSDEVMN